MLDFVREERPYVPNPTHPAEDYADKWSKDPRLERNFRLWHAQASKDFEQLSGCQRGARPIRWLPLTPGHPTNIGYRRSPASGRFSAGSGSIPPSSP